MASALLRASALRGKRLQPCRFRWGSGWQHTRRVSLPSCPLRRLINSGAQLNELVDEILARKGSSVPHDMMKSILLNSTLVLHESDAKNLSRTYMSTGVVAFGVFLGYAHATDRAKRTRDGARSAK